MRFIPSNCLRAGQVLASDLLLDKNRVLLRRGVALTHTIIVKIRQLGFQGVYIDDDVSKDILVADIISDELKYKAKKEIRSLFVSVEQNQLYKTDSHIEALGKVITGIVDELLYNKHIMVNIVDLRHLRRLYLLPQHQRIRTLRRAWLRFGHGQEDVERPCDGRADTRYRQGIYR